MRPIHILLIEDNEGDILLTQEALEDSKIIDKISIASNGDQAIKMLKKQEPKNFIDRPDLILLDINLPKKNGHQVLQEIKESEQLKKIPGIMLTTSSAAKEIEKAYKGYVSCYIVKPLDGDRYMDVIVKVENFWTTIAELPRNKNRSYGEG